MGLGLLSVGEDTGGLANVGSSNRSPWNVRGVPLGEELDNRLALSVLNDERVGLASAVTVPGYFPWTESYWKR